MSKKFIPPASHLEFPCYREAIHFQNISSSLKILAAPSPSEIYPEPKHQCLKSEIRNRERHVLESSEWWWRQSHSIWPSSEPWICHTKSRESCACSCFRTSPMTNHSRHTTAWAPNPLTSSSKFKSTLWKFQRPSLFVLANPPCAPSLLRKLIMCQLFIHKVDNKQTMRTCVLLWETNNVLWLLSALLHSFVLKKVDIFCSV